MDITALISKVEREHAVLLAIGNVLDQETVYILLCVPN
jgi:hypothetical protein